MHAYYDKYYECDKFIDNNLMVYNLMVYVSILCTEKSVIDLFHLTLPTNILNTK